MLIVKDVEKSYGDKKVLDGLSFYVKEGECAGLIGLNGAGKTTLIRILTGSLLPDGGIVRVNGLEPYFRQKELIPTIGMVSGTHSQLWADMPLRASLESCQKIYHITNEEYGRKIDELQECMEIKAFWEEEVNSLALGQKMLGEIAYTLLRSPSVLFLDEPTIGLAVDVERKVMQYLKKLHRTGKVTIFYTGHNMRDVELLCDHLILMNEGKAIFDGSIEELQEKYGIGDCLELVLAKGLFPDFDDLPIERFQFENDCLLIYYRKNVISNAVILNHVRKQCRILSIQTREPSLEETIRLITEG